MAKNIGPCFDFFIKKEGTKVEFVFLPGNVSKDVYGKLRDNLSSSFQKTFGENNYISKFNLNDGTPVIAIDQTKVLQVLSWLVGKNASSVFKAKITGTNKLEQQETILINSFLDVPKAAKVIPCCYVKDKQVNENNNKR